MERCDPVKRGSARRQGAGACALDVSLTEIERNGFRVAAHVHRDHHCLPSNRGRAQIREYIWIIPIQHHHAESAAQNLNGAS